MTLGAQITSTYQLLHWNCGWHTTKALKFYYNQQIALIMPLCSSMRLLQKPVRQMGLNDGILRLATTTYWHDGWLNGCAICGRAHGVLAFCVCARYNLILLIFACEHIKKSPFPCAALVSCSYLDSFDPEGANAVTRIAFRRWLETFMPSGQFNCQKRLPYSVSCPLRRASLRYWWCFRLSEGWSIDAGVEDRRAYCVLPMLGRFAAREELVE